MRVGYQELVDSDYATIRSLQQIAQFVSYQGDIRQAREMKIFFLVSSLLLTGLFSSKHIRAQGTYTFSMVTFGQFGADQTKAEIVKA